MVLLTMNISYTARIYKLRLAEVNILPCFNSNRVKNITQPL